MQLNTLRQNGRQFADDIFKCIFLHENVRVSIKSSLKLVPEGPVDKISALVRIMALSPDRRQAIIWIKDVLICRRIFASLCLDELRDELARSVCDRAYRYIATWLVSGIVGSNDNGNFPWWRGRTPTRKIFQILTTDPLNSFDELWNITSFSVLVNTLGSTYRNHRVCRGSEWNSWRHMRSTRS